MLEAVADFRERGVLRQRAARSFSTISEARGGRVVHEVLHLLIAHSLPQQVLVCRGAFLGHHRKGAKVDLVVGVRGSDGQDGAGPLSFQVGAVEGVALHQRGTATDGRWIKVIGIFVLSYGCTYPVFVSEVSYSRSRFVPHPNTDLDSIYLKT